MFLSKSGASLSSLLLYGVVVSHRKMFVILKEFRSVQSELSLVSHMIVTETLKELNIMRLSERRELICLKFAKNSLGLDNFKQLFPMFQTDHNMKTRQKEEFQVSMSHGGYLEISL